MPKSELEQLDERPQFYRRGFRNLLRVAYILTAVIFVLLLISFYQFFTTPTPNFFATTQDGRLIEIFPISNQGS